jgi:hypothetical protein
MELTGGSKTYFQEFKVWQVNTTDFSDVEFI